MTTQDLMIASFAAAVRASNGETLTLTPAGLGGLLLLIAGGGSKTALAYALRLPEELIAARAVEHLVKAANECLVDTMRPEAGEQR